MAKRRTAKGTVPSPPAGKGTVPFAYAVVALVAILSFAPAPWGALVWDDKMVIGQQLNSFVDWSDAIWPPAGIEQWSRAYYRPVVVASYMLDRALFGPSAFGAHAANVVYHAIASLGLLGLLRRLLAGRPAAHLAALAGAAIFAAHPVHSESVCWVSGRSDVLATMFLLPAVTLALRWRDTASVPALAGCGLLVLLALLAKETAAAALVVVPAAMLLAPGPRARGPSWAGITCALVAAVLATYALRDSAGVNAAPGPTAWATDALVAPRALAWLLVKLAWPWPQSQFVSVRSLPGIAAMAAVFAAALAYAAWSAVRWRRGDGLPALALLVFAAGAAPVMAAALMGVAEAPVAERYLYLPSVSLAILAGLAFAAAAARGWLRFAAALTVALVVALGAATILRTLVWHDDVTLWTDAVAKAPDEAVPLNELGAAIGSRGRYDEALVLWKRARALAPAPQTASIIDSNIGLVHFERHEYEEARRYFEASVRVNAWQYNAQRGLGASLFELSSGVKITPQTIAQLRALLESSRDHYEVAIRINPGEVRAHLELALVLGRLGDVHGALRDGENTGYYRLALGQLETAFALQPSAAQAPQTRALADALRKATGQP